MLSSPPPGKPGGARTPERPQSLRLCTRPPLHLPFLSPHSPLTAPSFSRNSRIWDRMMDRRSLDDYAGSCLAFSSSVGKGKGTQTLQKSERHGETPSHKERGRSPQPRRTSRDLLGWSSVLLTPSPHSSPPLLLRLCLFFFPRFWDRSIHSVPQKDTAPPPFPTQSVWGVLRLAKNASFLEEKFHDFLAVCCLPRLTMRTPPPSRPSHCSYRSLLPSYILTVLFSACTKGREY